MSVSSVPSNGPAQIPAAKPPATVPKAPIGESLVRTSKTSQTKDSDGDYRLLPKTTAAASSPSVQAALNNLKLGG